jgi:hypothetical protein
MKILGLAAFMATVLASEPVTAAARTVADVPMRFYGTRPAVDVTVNGKGPFLFLIDTGASGQARADASLVKELGLVSVGETTADDRSKGQGARLDEVRLPSVTLAGVRFDDVQAFSRNYNTSTYLPKIAGILGLGLFEPYLLTLDYPGRRVRLEVGALPPADGRTVLPFEREDGLAYFMVQIGGKPVKAVIDSGNVRGFDVPSEMIRGQPLASYPILIGKGGSANGEQDLKQVELADEVRIGMHRITPPVVTFSDSFGDTNLGSTWMRSFAVTIDQKTNRVRFVRPPSRP